MRPMRSSESRGGKRRPWEPPLVAKLDIGTETKSTQAQPTRPGMPSSEQDRFFEPLAPASPAAKFGFSFEWSFPLSSRTED
jgi:hypothetical protein